MAIKTQPNEIYREYQDGIAYNQRVDLYETVERNENFYIGKCWEGVNAPDLDKPVIPLLKRAVSQFIAMIVSDDIASQITSRQPGNEDAVAILQHEIEGIIEDEKIKAKNRLLLRNAAVDGDCCVYLYFDDEAKTGQDAKGRCRAMVLDNSNVIFGNPHEQDVQEQPYVILPLRELVEDVKREAKHWDAPETDIDQIKEDTDETEYGNDTAISGLCTTLIKLWRDHESGTIHAIKTTVGVTVRPEWDTKYRIYPLAYMPWEPIKNSYHGASAMAGLIPNQIFINKLYAMAMRYVTCMAFPKIAYDKTRLPGGITNKIGEAIAVTGSPNDVIFKPLQMADMSNQVFVMIDKVIEHTQNLIGASDVMLGNVRPENTSAIIALTKSSAIPLEIQRLNFYQFVEDYVRVMIEIISTNYGERILYSEAEDGTPIQARFDFASLRDMDFRLNIDVGQSAYWSELMQLQTIDNMWMQKIIQDPIDYLENMPNGILKNKNALILKFKQLQALVAQQPPEMPGAPDPDGGPEMPQQPDGAMPAA